jgi:glycosidase
MMWRKTGVFTVLFFICAAAFAQHADLYPSNWWIGMKWNKVQVLVHGDYDLSQTKVEISHPGVKLDKVTVLENPHYLALDVTVSPKSKPGNVRVDLISHGKTNSANWPLKARRTEKGKSYAQGITASDFIYLLMPDRFSNGDPSNDRVPGMRDQSLNRDSIYLRHGGDLQGVINHLDYLQGLGVTALWMTPVLENDMPNRTEHGYAFTNHYTIEPRIGGAVAYKKLSDALHQRGMKLIQDAVYNHLGSYHFTVLDPPMKDWVNPWPTYTSTNHRNEAWMDPYATQKDKKLVRDGWFVPSMPDVNQNNPFAANFLIQHALWSVEEFGVDGWRIDTYFYNDLNFMNRCNQALYDEYPNITMFGENWVQSVSSAAYFTRNNFAVPFKSNLTGDADFQVNFSGIQPALTETPGWDQGVIKLYRTLSQDFMYQNPMNNVIFLDNHDMTRFYTQVGEDVEKLKAGIAWLLTCRGIPEMYYGTEVLMKGSVKQADGWVRLDFPGGWPGDPKNAFSGQGLSPQESEVLTYTRQMANFRKNSSAIKSGSMMHYAPVNGLYIYFRYDASQTVMCIMNTAAQEKAIDLGDYDERTKGFLAARDITNGGKTLGRKFAIPAGKMWVLELIR